MNSTALLIGAGKGFNGLREEARELLTHDNLTNVPEPSNRQLAEDLAMINGRTLEFQESVTMWLTELMVILLTGIQDFPLESAERKSALELIGIKDSKFKKKQTEVKEPERGTCDKEPWWSGMARISGKGGDLN